MIMTCELCGNDFLTEADPYVIQNTPQGQKYYCNCMISNHNQISSIDKLQAENKKLRDALEEIAKSEYEANPWTIVPTKESKIAKKALKE